MSEQVEAEQQRLEDGDAPGEAGAPARNGPDRGRRIRGLVRRQLRPLTLLAAVFALTASLFQAMATPQLLWRDEVSHVSYASAMSRGQLPTVDTPIASAGADRAFDAFLEKEWPRYRMVWTANHPPGANLLNTPGAWLGRILDRGWVAIAWARIVNALGMATSVILTGVLARQLSRRPAASDIAAWFVATTPLISSLGSIAMTDGWSLAVALVAVIAAVRCCDTGFERRATIWLAVACAACGLTRLTSVAVAAMVTAAALGVVAVRDRRVPWFGALVPFLATLVVSGWWWARNLWLYGDLAGSHILYERFDRVSPGSVVDVLTDRAIWRALVHGLFFSGPGKHPPSGRGVLVVIGIGLVAAVVVGLELRRDRARLGAWLILLPPAAAVAITTAIHVAGGGSLFARYLLFWIPCFGVLLAAAATSPVLSRRARMASLGAVIGFGTWRGLLGWQGAMHRIAESRFFFDLDPNPLGPTEIQTAVAAVGLLAIAGLLVWWAVGPGGDALRRWSRSRSTLA